MPPPEEQPPEEPPDEEPPSDEPSGEDDYSATPSAPDSSPNPTAAITQQPSGPVRPAFAAARLAHIKGSSAFMRLRCRGQAACRGVAKLVDRVRVRRSARRSAKRVRSVVLGRSRFRVPAGRAKVLRIRLNRKGRRLLLRAGRRGMRARLVGRGLRNRMVRLKPRRLGKRGARRSVLMATQRSGRRRGEQRKRRTPPDRLTLKFKWKPLPPLAEPTPGAPTEGRAFYGKLSSHRKACRRVREVFARYEFPPYTGKPLIREMWRNDYSKVTTDGRGVWKADPVVFSVDYRVTAFVKPRTSGRNACHQVESRPLTFGGAVRVALATLGREDRQACPL